MSKLGEAQAIGTLPSTLQRQADLILLRELCQLYPAEAVKLVQEILDAGWTS